MKKSNYTSRHGKPMYRLQRKVGMRLNQDTGAWESHIKSFYGSNRAEAERKYVEYMAERKNAVIKANYTCLGEAIDIWIQDVFIRSDLAPSTKIMYISAYTRAFRPSFIAGQPISEVTALDIQKLYNESEEAYATLRALHNLLIRFYRYAEKNNFARDITGTIEVTRPSKMPDDYDDNKMDVWDDEDLKRLIDTLEGSPLRFLCLLAVNTGCRIAELLALRYSDIIEGNLYISKQVHELPGKTVNKDRVTPILKTMSGKRVIPLAAEMMEELAKHKALQKKLMRKYGYDNDGFIFTTKNGTLYYRRNITRAIKRHCKRYDITYHSFHAFRRTYGSNLAREDVRLEDIAELMGHSSVEVSAQYYINVEAERKKHAAEKIAKYSFDKQKGN